ncbi:hypothetical protein BD324DRAFT_617275 [Kockovaella imperatae]|uniref:Macrofage activating glycoprotein n=1 Tax=Kockovaella imperatae TaxID=4999 RepID=A0A1Y1UQS6_9TREE|nr:hypothetical protein BD324DRAFT_617275 [Kockovaella imperatae]ORX40312.1 hypothetical protein BD324DRAFT_617275 [Kockovaella imperatae]
MFATFEASLILVGATTAFAKLSSTITAPAGVPTANLDKRVTYSPNPTETTSPYPLTAYHFPYSALPEQVNPINYGRGPQSGYNICNHTTEGPDSMCQTAIVNSIADFCIWGGPGLESNQSVGDFEGASVAYCSRSGYGTRIFPPGTFTALQFMRTPGYIQIVGLFNQTAVGLTNSDEGGELDPHGADGLGNPIGGLVYSKSLPSGDNTTYMETQSWNNFLDSDRFCFKLCDPNYQTEYNYCQNIYDLIGCDYNAPAAYEEGVFLSCDGDMQDEVGTYTSDGQTYTWSQPTSLPPGYNMPYTPTIPASSNCVTYQSTDLFPTQSLGYQSTNNVFGALGPTSASAASSSTGSVSASRATTSSQTGSKTKSTTASASTATTKTGAATRLTASALPITIGLGLLLMVMN